MKQLPHSTVAEANVLPFATDRAGLGAEESIGPVTEWTDLDLVRRLLNEPFPPSDSTQDLAERLLGGSPSARGLAELLNLTPDRLRFLGLPPRAASRLLAAVEIARRIAWGQVPEERPLTRPEEIARYLFLRYARVDQEAFGAVLLDSGNRWIADVEVARGTFSRISVEPRQVLVEALLRGATGFVLFHNHPSRNPEPSGEDVAITRLFELAGEAVGVRLIDHLVLGSTTRWVSIRDRRPW